MTFLCLGAFFEPSSSLLRAFFEPSIPPSNDTLPPTSPCHSNHFAPNPVHITVTSESPRHGVGEGFQPCVVQQHEAESRPAHIPTSRQAQGPEQHLEQVLPPYAQDPITTNIAILTDRSLPETAVNNFFKPSSQKPKERTSWSERAPSDDTPATLLVGRHEPEHIDEADRQKRTKIAAFDLVSFCPHKNYTFGPRLRSAHHAGLDSDHHGVRQEIRR